MRSVRAVLIHALAALLMYLVLTNMIIAAAPYLALAVILYAIFAVIEKWLPEDDESDDAS